MWEVNNGHRAIGDGDGAGAGAGSGAGGAGGGGADDDDDDDDYDGNGKHEETQGKKMMILERTKGSQRQPAIFEKVLTYIRSKR